MVGSRMPERGNNFFCPPPAQLCRRRTITTRKATLHRDNRQKKNKISYPNVQCEPTFFYRLTACPGCVGDDMITYLKSLAANGSGKAAVYVRI